MNNSSATTSSATNPASSLAYYTQILMTVQFGVSLVGFFLNLALLWIILKTKIRRNNYDIQLGALSLFDSMSMTSAFFTMYLALMGQTVSLLLCWLFQSISIFGSTCSFMIIFFISADRFWATIFPLHYNNLMSDKMKRRRYMAVILVAPQFVGLLTMTAYGAAVIESGTAEKRVTCQSGDLSMSFARRFTLATSLIFNISTVVIYSAIWFFVKVRKISSGIKDRVGRSLMLIIATTLFFWCLSTTFNNFITPLIDNQLVQMVSSRLFIIALKIVAAINLPMVYVCCYNNLMSDKMKRRRYMAVILVAPQFVGLLTMATYCAAVIESGTADKRVTCQSGDLSMSFARRFSLTTSMIFNISTVVIYLAIWFFVKVRKISSGVKDRVSRSLMLIIATTLFFWCLSTTFNNFITPLIDNQLVQMVSSRLFIIALKIVAAINLPMVYVCCTDYRKLINAECRKLFGCICFCAGMNAATHPTNTTQMVAASPISINGVNYGRAAARQQQQIRRGI